jgi:hypothetical protein
MHVFVLFGIALVFMAPNPAAGQTFYLHHSGSPVSVACGTSSFFMDETAPIASSPTVEDLTVAQGATVPFPTFTGQSLPATRVREVVSARLNLSASQQMKQCADVEIELHRLSTGCGDTLLGTQTLTGATIPQGKNAGTAGFVPVRVEFALADLDRNIGAGEALVLSAETTNNCSNSRHVFLAYDSSSAASRLIFQCCTTAASKCSAKKIKLAGDKGGYKLKCHAKAIGKGEPVDAECLTKAEDKFVSGFTKEEAKGGCPTTGDAAAIEAAVDAYVDDVRTLLEQGTPPSRCTSKKLAAAGKLFDTRATCESKAMAKAVEVDPACLSKADTKLAATFQKAEDSSGDCLAPNGDAATIQTTAATAVAGIVDQLRCPCASPSGAFLDTE